MGGWEDGGWGMGEVIFKKPMVEMFFKMIREGTEKRKRVGTRSHPSCRVCGWGCCWVSYVRNVRLKAVVISKNYH